MTPTAPVRACANPHRGGASPGPAAATGVADRMAPAYAGLGFRVCYVAFAACKKKSKACGGAVCAFIDSHPMREHFTPNPQRCVQAYAVGFLFCCPVVVSPCFIFCCLLRTPSQRVSQLASQEARGQVLKLTCAENGVLTLSKSFD